MHDVNFLDQVAFTPGGHYALDRGYVDCKRLHKIHVAGAWFVTRAKKNMSFYVVQSGAADKACALRCDQAIRLNGPNARRDYPEALRRISYHDAETQKRLVFLTNNLDLPALTIAAIHKRRWEIAAFKRRCFFCARRSASSAQKFLGMGEGAFGGAVAEHPGELADA